MEDHNLVECRADNQEVHFQPLVKMTNQKAVGNLELGTNLEVDNPKARTESGVDKHPEEYTEFGLTLGYVLS